MKCQIPVQSDFIYFVQLVSFIGNKFVLGKSNEHKILKTMFITYQYRWMPY